MNKLKEFLNKEYVVIMRDTLGFEVDNPENVKTLFGKWKVKPDVKNKMLYIYPCRRRDRAACECDGIYYIYIPPKIKDKKISKIKRFRKKTINLTKLTKEEGV